MTLTSKTVLTLAHRDQLDNAVSTYLQASQEWTRIRQSHQSHEFFSVRLFYFVPTGM